MDMTTVWLLIGCLVFLIIGIVCFKYYYNRVKSWKGAPSTEEYFSCLFIGWCSWMLIVIAGGCTLFVLPVFVMEVIKFLF